MIIPLIDAHVHSKFSPDSDVLISEIAAKGTELGLREIAIVDHCYKIDHIQRLNERVIPIVEGALTLYLGAELSLEEDIAQVVLKNRKELSSQIVSGAVHGFPGALYPEFDNSGHLTNSFKIKCANKNTDHLIDYYVNRTLSAINSGGLDILCHPFDVMFYGGIRCDRLFADANRIIKAAAQNTVTIELNNHVLAQDSVLDDMNEFRMELYNSFLTFCVSEGVTLSWGSDAHYLYTVGDVSNVREFLQRLSIRGLCFIDSLEIFK